MGARRKYRHRRLELVILENCFSHSRADMLTLYFVDSVTGVIVNGDMRQRASEPVHLVHSENWVALMYFNDKARRSEIVTYELYEGKTQKNSTGKKKKKLNVFCHLKEAYFVLELNAKSGCVVHFLCVP